MSKEQYIDTFSNIRPSDEAIERIMNMTSKKQFTSISKAVIALVAIISIICSIGFVANAATDGSVSKTVSEVFESISNKIIVLINGEKASADISVTEKTDADGEKYYEAEVKVDVPDDSAKVEYKFQLDNTTALDDNLSENAQIHIYKKPINPTAP